MSSPQKPIAKFNGFSLKAEKFFKALKKNNNKLWYEKNKSIYQTQVVEPAASLVVALGQQKKFKELGLYAKHPRRAIFRLHRDVRFSNNKSPYKTYGGLVLSRSGDRGDTGVFYFHLQPGDSFIAAGFWMPEPALLAKFRLWMASNPKEFVKLRSNLKKGHLELSQEDTLIRSPRGFEYVTDKDICDFIKLKSFVCVRALSSKDLQSVGLVKKINQFISDSSPLFKLGWRLLDQWRNEGGDLSYQEKILGEKIILKNIKRQGRD